MEFDMILQQHSKEGGRSKRTESIPLSTYHTLTGDGNLWSFLKNGGSVKTEEEYCLLNVPRRIMTPSG